MDFSIAVVFPGHSVGPPTAPTCDPEREQSKLPMLLSSEVLSHLPISYEFVVCICALPF